MLNPARLRPLPLPRLRLLPASPQPRLRALHHLLTHPHPHRLSALTPLPPHSVISSTERRTRKKSIFVGHVVRVRSWDEAILALEHVLTIKRVNKASHNILAWRFRSGEEGLGSGPTTLLTEGHDDGGEATAGRKLLRQLQLANVVDVLLVVTRWHGGVPLGPDRFKMIAMVAKEALELSGFAK